MTFFNLYNWRKKAISLLISGLMISCSPLNPLGLASQEYTAIAQLGKLTNKSRVNLRGMVVNVAPFLDGGAYQLQDATGLIWVRTDKPLPAKGTSLSVKGELQYEGIFVGQQQLGESYLLEVSQEPQSATVTNEVILDSTRNPNETSTNPNIPAKSDRVPVIPIPSPTPTTEVNKTIPVPAIENSLPVPTPSIEVKETKENITPPLISPEPAKVSVPIASPLTKPISSPSTTKQPNKLDLNDRLLPHKSLQK